MLSNYLSHAHHIIHHRENAVRSINDNKINYFDILFVNKISQELSNISKILDANKLIYKIAYKDLLPDSNVGRKGLSAEQVVRIAILKQFRCLTYEELEFHLADSSVFRSFAKLMPGHYPKKSTIQENVKRVSAESWISINKVIVNYSLINKIEIGEQIRIDATPVETNIHKPSDSSLIVDGIRVITRMLDEANELFQENILQYSNHNRAAKKKHVALETKNNKGIERNKKYKVLIKLAENVVNYADNAIQVLKCYNFADLFDTFAAKLIANRIDYFADLLFRVIDQTKRRIFDNEKVPARQKIFSIFEEHTDIISKKNRADVFGHKIFLSAGKSGIVTDCLVVKGNPNDATVFNELLERQKEVLGKTPKKLSADGGFASKDNLQKAKQAGVEDMAFAKKRGLKVLDMVKSEWIYEKLRRFRAGIEGIISVLKRAFGFDRCTWTTWEGFNQYVQSCVVAFNLQVLARA